MIVYRGHCLSTYQMVICRTFKSRIPPVFAEKKETNITWTSIQYDCQVTHMTLGRGSVARRSSECWPTTCETIVAKKHKTC